jgi:hypothetical protein
LAFGCHEGGELLPGHGERLCALTPEAVDESGPPEQGGDVGGEFVDDGLWGGCGCPEAVPDREVVAGTPASSIVGTSVSRPERWVVVTPSGTRRRSRMSRPAAEIGDIT